MKKLKLCPVCETGTMLTLFEHKDGRGVSECIQCKTVLNFDSCQCVDCGGKENNHCGTCIDMINMTSNIDPPARDWIDYAKAKDVALHPNHKQTDLELLEEVAFIYLPFSSYLKLVLGSIFHKIIKTFTK